MEIDSNVYKVWLRKRKMTFIIGCVNLFFYGMERTSINISGLYYFKEDIPTDNPKFFYGLALSVMCMSSVISEPIVGKYIDRTRNLRRTVLVVAMLNMLGSLIYTINTSRWYPIAGRFICGISIVNYTVFIGEFRRCYTKTEISKILVIYQIAFSIGVAVGPLTPILFTGLDFRIGSWHINQNNAIGLFQAIVLVMLMVSFYFGVSNLTKDDGYKVFVEHGNCDYDVDEKVVLLSFKDLFKNYDYMLVVAMFAFLDYISMTIELNVNATSLYAFHWSINRLSLVSMLVLVVSSLLVYKGQYLMKTTMDVYHFTFIVITGLWIVLLLLILPALTQWFIQQQILQTALIGIVLICKYFFGPSLETCGFLMVFHLVPYHSTSYAVGWLAGCTRIAEALGFLFAGYLFSASIYIFVFPVYILVLITFVLLLFARRKFYV